MYWRTENQVLSISERPGSAWLPLARYEVDGGTLLLVYYDGSRHLWQRH